MVVSIENLVKKYGNLTALDGINLNINKGEIFGLLGPNGSGKSTAINCILSLLNYSEGKIKVFDKPMSPSAYDLKSKIGIVMQDVAVYEELTVKENIDFFCGLYITDSKKRKVLVDEAIEFVGLKDYSKFKPKKLSGGLLRRLNIACGIAHKPELIIMDEPTVAVDPQSRNNILEGIVRMNRHGATVIYTSHYMEEVEQICSRIAILDKGKIIAEGTTTQLKEIADVGEKIIVENIHLNKENVKYFKNNKNIIDVQYSASMLNLQSKSGTKNLIDTVAYLQSNNISYSTVYTTLPTLNDVFLTLTGKELRD